MSSESTSSSSNRRVAKVTSHLAEQREPKLLPKGVKNAHLMGNFKPVSDEGHFEDLEIIEGSVPEGT